MTGHNSYKDMLILRSNVEINSNGNFSNDLFFPGKIVDHVEPNVIAQSQTKCEESKNTIHNGLTDDNWSGEIYKICPSFVTIET